MAATPKVRYAAPDPTLPKPWKGLIDVTSGFLYFWNPETKTATYEHPVEGAPPPPPPECLPPRRREEEEDGGDRGGWSHQDQGAERESSSQIPGGVGKVSREPSGMHGSQQSAPVSKEPGEEYRRKHEITIVGGNVPLPYTSFEAADFPAEILREHPLQLASPARQRPEPQAYPLHPQEPFLTIDDHQKLPHPRQRPEPQAYPNEKRDFLWCNVCSVPYPNDKNAEQHFLGKKHKKNLLKLDEKKILRCEQCNIYCRGHIEMAKHQNGKKHLSKLAAKHRADDD